MSRIDANIATQVGDLVRPTNTVVDRQNQQQQALVLQGQAAATSGQVPVGADSLHAAAAQLKQVVEAASSRRLSMDIDHDSEQAFMRVTDLHTGEVIKQIPSKEVLELHARLRDFIGMFIDLPAAVLLLTPMFVPLASAVGMDPIQLGLMMVVNLAIGLYTPPVGTTLFITSARDGGNRLFVLERAGLIRILEPGSPAPAPTPFLDLTAKVLTTTSLGDERGLLGLAFHPQFKTNRRFFVNYTRRNDGATVISEFTASMANANVADTTEKPILTIAQPFSNHNGGMMDFGKDGFLYIGMGDGGSANDPGNRAQNNEELLGKFLRIDVDTPKGAEPYSSPASNPFFGATPGRDEIYSTGWRNPWRWSFDRQTGELYAGDVGQNAMEEIDIVTLGGNYGWRVLEGTRCTNLGPAACTTPGFIAPIHEYGRAGGRC